jgi:hypothetical protein
MLPTAGQSIIGRRPKQKLLCSARSFVAAQTSGNADARVQFHQLYDELVADETRNRLICDDIIQATREGRSPIVLTERNEHLDRLTAAMSSVRCAPTSSGGVSASH